MIEELSSFLAHPFVLLITGALISTVFTAYLTQRWQNRKKEFEVQLTLINEITETSVLLTSALSSRFNETISDEKSELALIKISKMGAMLFAYFPNTTLPNEWEDYKIHCLAIWDIATKLKDPDVDYNKFKQRIEQIQTYCNKILPGEPFDLHLMFKDKNRGEFNRVVGRLLNHYKYFVQEIRRLKIKI